MADEIRKVRPIFCVLTAAFSSERKASYERLYAELQPQCVAAGFEVLTHFDSAGKGSLGPWLHICQRAIESDATHMVFLPDDAILVPHFVEVITKCIEARPEAIICCQSNHTGARVAYDAGYHWYATPDGCTLFGGVLPIAWVREHLSWRKRALKPNVLVQGDEGVNLWAMATNRLIYKPLPSLVDHDTTLKSLDGNDEGPNAQSPRRSVVWEPEADLRNVDWSGKALNLGRTYEGNHWRLVLDLETPMPDRMYEVQRQKAVSPTPYVYIATPCYGGMTFADYTQSTHMVAADLTRHDVSVCFDWSVADSLVQRARNRLMHRFLASPCTHLLFWDADVVPEDPSLVRRMLETGFPIVGGAYPFKDDSGRVVVTTWDDPELQPVKGAIEVMDVPTGFLLIERSVLIDLMRRHPETMYQSDSPNDRGQPMYALFEAGIYGARYLSEDYMFCQRAQAAGHRVRCMVDAAFRHHGSRAYRGNFAEKIARKSSAA